MICGDFPGTWMNLYMSDPCFSVKPLFALGLLLAAFEQHGR